MLFRARPWLQAQLPETNPEKSRTYSGKTQTSTLCLDISGESSTLTFPSSEGLAPEPYQRSPHFFIIIIQNSGICIEPRSGMCIDSDIACVQTLFGEKGRVCVVGVGGSGMVGDVAEVEGRQSKDPGGANGRHGGRGEEFKDQHVGKGRRIEEGEDRYGGTGVDSSAERTGPEDFMHIGIEKREENMVDCWGRRT